MHIAILSDIHSNLEALRKAFSLIDELHVDEICCLGDIVGYGGNPNECIDLVRQRATHCVLGNHDLAALDTSHAQYFTKDGQAVAHWTHKVLTNENSDYLASLPYIITSELLTLVHANPCAPEQWGYIVSLEEAQPEFECFKTPFCFIGHSHIPFICGEDLKTFHLKKDIRFLINVGSVGQPRDHNPQLSFGLLDTDAWTYQTIRADYNIQTAAEAITGNNLPHFFAERLFRGV